MRNELLFRCGLPSSTAFEALGVNGAVLREEPHVRPKQVLSAVVPKGSPCVLSAQHVAARVRELFRLVCEQDLEGIVAKRKSGVYRPELPSAWVKMKNRGYSQARDREELFVRRAGGAR